MKKKVWKPTPGFLHICKTFVDTFGSASSFDSIEEWVAGFLLDAEASRELVLWMCMRNVFRDRTAGLGEEEKKAFFADMLKATTGDPALAALSKQITDEIDVCLNELSEYTVVDGKIMLFT